ncbi:MAG: ATP-dependent helicase RecQ, partial [Clostridia bacterium]|nr:ATP-dependent helicase RecQ [Clostridia bacterium]
NGSSNVDKTNEYKKLQEMVDYCNTDGCLRKYILSYFGEDNFPKGCDHCGNCVGNLERTDITIEAQKILSCIKRTGERFGSGIITDVLRGSGSEKLKTMGFDKLPTFGLMKEYAKETIKEIIAYLIAENFIDVRGDKYPILALNAKAYGLLKGEDKLYIKRIIAKEEKKAKKAVHKMNNNLFEKLRGLRRIIAEEMKVPPFIVFSDTTLKDMCSKLPVTYEEMLTVSGVGKFKLEKYGDRFIEVIKDAAQQGYSNLNE